MSSLAIIPPMTSVCDCDAPLIDACLQPLIDAVQKGTVEKVKSLIKEHTKVLSNPIRHRIAHVAFDRYLENIGANFHYHNIASLVDPNFFQ